MEAYACWGHQWVESFKSLCHWLTSTCCQLDSCPSPDLDCPTTVSRKHQTTWSHMKSSYFLPWKELPSFWKPGSKNKYGTVIVVLITVEWVSKQSALYSYNQESMSHPSEGSRTPLDFESSFKVCVVKIPTWEGHRGEQCCHCMKQAVLVSPLHHCNHTFSVHPAISK